MIRWLVISMLVPMVGLSQTNLVPNGSFEVLDSCPVGLGADCIGLVEYARGWYEPTICSSDLFHACTDGSCTVPTFESVIPLDGNGMSRILLMSGNGNQSREYIAIELSQSLQTDSLYLFSLNLHLADNELRSVGSLGAYFSPDSAVDFSISQQLLPYLPQIQRNPNLIMDDFNVWYFWEDTLVADGAEKFVLIGNFLNDSNTPFYQVGWNPSSAYFIDDVRLTKIPKPNSINELDVRFGISPNPVNNFLSIDYQGNLDPIITQLFTIEGRQVFSAPWQRNLDVSGLSEGLYLLQVEFDNGAVGTQRLVVQR